MDMEINRMGSATGVQTTGSTAVSPQYQQAQAQQSAGVTSDTESKSIQKNAASISLSSEGQALAKQMKAPTVERTKSPKLTSQIEAKALMQQIKKNLTENPEVTREVHSNLNVMRIMHKIY